MKLTNFNKTCRLLLISIIIFLFNTNIYSQKTGNDGYLVTPEVFKTYCKQSYLKDIKNNKIDLRELEYKGQTTWIVYSDRENNVLYSRKNGQRKSDKLSYMERLAVKEVEGSWLLVYSLIYNKSGTAEYNKERGWVKSDKLILSDMAALLNDKSSTKKAMILLTVTGLDPSTMNEYKDELRNKYFYNSPDNSVSNRTGGKAGKFQIYYILKETQSMVLLSSTDKLNGGEKALQGRVQGWMPKINITNWDHRVCWEINYGKSVSNEYSGYQIPVFNTNKTKITDFIENGDITISKKSIIKYISISEKRTNPYTMRMPILETDVDNIKIKKVATIASIDNGKTDGEIAKIKIKIEGLKTSFNNIDILFVVDATKSMIDYYPSVSKSIKNIIKNNELSGTGSKLRFGLAVYRDYPDGKNVFSIQTLTSNYNIVLNKVKHIDCDSKARSIPEAQYQGLVKGIEQAGFNKSHSNIVVLIGDVGNHNPDPKSYSINQVVEQMAKYSISLIAFQVIAGDNIAYTKFNWDVQDYLRKTAKVGLVGNAKVKLEQINSKNTYKLAYENSSEDAQVFNMFGRFTYATGERPMSTSILEENINDATISYLNRVQQRISVLETLVGSDKVSEDYTQEFIKYLISLGFTQEQITLLMSMGDISAKGYTAQSFYDKDLDCYYPVVFLSYDEKREIDRILGKLSRIGGGSQAKQNFKNAMLEQTKEMLGAPIEIVEGMTMNEVWDIILGVPFNGDARIAKVKLRDMNKLDDSIFGPFYDKFKNSADNFRKSSFDDSMFKLAGQKFYWIPLNEMPGNE